MPLIILVVLPRLLSADYFCRSLGICNANECRRKLCFTHCINAIKIIVLYTTRKNGRREKN